MNDRAEAQKANKRRREPDSRPKAAAAATDHPPPEENDYRITGPGEFARNMVHVGIQSQRLLGDFLKNQAAKFGSEPFDPLNLAGTFMDLLRGMVADPAAIMEAQFALWRDYMGLWERTARRMMGGETEPMVSPAPGDKRFRDKDWQE